MTPEALVEALRRRDGGVGSTSIAVNLLAGHGHWPRVFAADPQAWGITVVGTDARIDWRELHRRIEAGEIVGSSSQIRILRIACSFGGGTPVDLRDATFGLDGGNAGLVADAVVRAAGHMLWDHRRAAAGALGPLRVAKQHAADAGDAVAVAALRDVETVLTAVAR